MGYLRVLRRLLKTNWWKTFWINFKMLPFRQACKFPIYVYGKAQFRNLSGKIIIDAKDVYSGMIKIGKKDYYVATAVQKCVWNVSGTILFHGSVHFMQGSYVLVAPNATLEITGNHGLCGSNIRICCFDHISIGQNVELTWDIQLMDSSFHYVELLNKEGLVKPLTAPIHIGDYVWVGNRTTIAKGSVIPSHTVVASNSVVNKDFSDIEPDSLLAGMPATVKATGYHRIFDKKQERNFDQQFGYTRTHL